ncbi:MAG: Rieske 2Fe-2S domain-containing protein [Caldisericaceae bacterium]
MIRNQWYAVLSSHDVKDKPVGVTRFGEKLVFWRGKDNSVNCIADKCAHRGASLSLGKIVDEHIQCPFHGFQYDGSGRVVEIPANGKNTPVPPNFKVNSYKAIEKYDFVWVWYGNSEPQGEPRFFDDIDGSFVYSEFTDPWKTHYSRCIENQLDVVHLPFVHYNTIGRGNKTLVDGPVLEWKDKEKFYFYVFNRLDDGTPPKKPEDLKGQKSTVYLEFIFPNVWQNHIDDNFMIAAAFVPIDNENTLVYIRSYVKLTKFKPIDRLIAAVSKPGDKIILHQDRRVVETQLPKRSELKMNENLIQGDLPIIEYRKRRQELIDLNKE